jgi:diguanylate cyclase (GGDEF)-like protein
LPSEQAQIVVALAEALSGAEGSEDYQHLAESAAGLAGEGVSAPEALRQVTLLGETLYEGAGSEHGGRILRYIGRAGEAVASTYLKRAQGEARRDYLTALPNDLAFADDLSGAVLRTTSPAGGSVALATCDLNGMKVVNDSQGHPAGNEYLRRFATVLRDVAQSHQGRAYRVHGDEFYVLFRDPDVELVRRGMQEAQARPDSPTFSFGIATCPDDDTTSEGLERLADERLYAMKDATPKEQRDEITRRWLEGDHWNAAGEVAT